ncbi:putative ubiquitin carboxyl-terminal hydrolase 50 isoform X1 [Poecilia reticulata]|uniref:putative ubiquitin carboxyl-terminal hydrolase 50 isoform X1 n=1 Tax=Poecilia reticulata TaxID=8081 RepID=UPI0007EBE4E9|nr:PREDICTED: inactive ubiquitin carboxyl-terminal hydrolase 50 isoform X1 [Poecilia reticulata]
MYLYSPEQLQTQSNAPVVAQVVKRLVEPFCGHGRIVQLDNSARMEGRLKIILSELQDNIRLPPSEKKQTIPPASSLSPSKTSEESKSELTAHLQGCSGPALLPLSDLRGSGADAFMPGFWVALHTVCINMFLLHTLQRQASGSTVPLPGFTRALASQLAADGSMAVPVLPRLNSCSNQETTSLSQQRSNTNGCFQMMEGTSYNLRSRPCTPSNKEGKPGVVGLDNIGNSCYFNAVMQCLCSTMPFVEDLLSQETRRELAKCECRIAQVFVQLLERMWQGSSPSCSPVQVMAALPSIFPQFGSYTQQDAQELLLHLLDALHEDLKKMDLSRKQPGNNQNRSSKTESTIISDLFEGQLNYLTSFLHCGHEDCLSLFFEETVLTGAEQSDCSDCGRKREATVQTYLNKPPEILVLHLKRFGCKGRKQVKLSANVSFSMELDITPFLSSSVRRRSSYHLYAVVIHRGNLDMGHYTALCYNSVLETWHWFDDSLVREVHGSVVQSPDAYVLFYSCKPF